MQVGEDHVADVGRVDAGVGQHRQRVLAVGALEGAVPDVLPDEGRVRRAGVDHDRVLAADDHEHDHREPLVLAPASLVGDRGLMRLGYNTRRQCQNLQTHCSLPCPFVIG